jgi:peroxiredoxin
LHVLFERFIFQKKELINMTKRFLLAVACGGMVLLGCSKADRDGNAAGNNHTASNSSEAVSEKEKLADFSLKTLNGETVNLRSLEGKKVVVVNFWATWCGPCRHEIPDFNNVYSRYRERGVEILGISVDQSPETEVPPFLRTNPIDYPVLAGSPELAYQYGVRGFPTTFIIARSGRVAKRIIGPMTAATLEAELEKLL